MPIRLKYRTWQILQILLNPWNVNSFIKIPGMSTSLECSNPSENDVSVPRPCEGTPPGLETARHAPSNPPLTAARPFSRGSDPGRSVARWPRGSPFGGSRVAVCPSSKGDSRPSVCPTVARASRVAAWSLLRVRAHPWEPQWTTCALIRPPPVTGRFLMRVPMM